MSVINEAVAGHTVNQVTLGALDVSFVPQGAEPCAAPRLPAKRVSGRTAGSAVCRWLMHMLMHIHVMCREAHSCVCNFVSLQVGALAPQRARLTCGAPALWDTSLQVELCPSLSLEAG